MYDELIKRLIEPCQYENCILCQQAADAIEKLQKMVEQYKVYLQDAINDLHSAHEKEQKWIPVTERLPEYGKHVLIYAGFFQPYIEAAYYCEDKKWRFTYDDAEVVGVSHWMQLPEPPKEE